VSSIFYLFSPLPPDGMLFNQSIELSETTRVFRLLILIASTISMLFMVGQKTHFEIPILITISTAALMLMVSSNDLMTMYLTMELSAIAMYICVASDLKSYQSTEASLKYFILGSIASCLFLLGSSTISGFAGSFSFEAIGKYSIDLLAVDIIPILMVFSSIMIMSAFFFKMAVAPFHSWIADVYNGAPWYISLFLGSASKIAIIGLFIRCIFSLFDNVQIQIQHILMLISVLSMFIGSIAAIIQKDLKRILAYSSIGNMGFALAAISTTSLNGISSGFVYIILYSIIMFIPAFAIIGSLTSSENNSLLLSDLKKLNISNPYKTATLAFLMLSVAGLPPFAGFFGKFYMLMQLISHDMIVLSILFVIAAVLSSVYCIKIVKNIYFSTYDVSSIDCIKCHISIHSIILLSILCILNIIYCAYSSQTMNFFLELFSNQI
jgi:NADH-quinone oxidoreductase subunit N